LHGPFLPSFFSFPPLSSPFFPFFPRRNFFALPPPDLSDCPQLIFSLFLSCPPEVFVFGFHADPAYFPLFVLTLLLQDLTSPHGLVTRFLSPSILASFFSAFPFSSHFSPHYIPPRVVTCAFSFISPSPSTYALLSFVFSERALTLFLAIPFFPLPPDPARTRGTFFGSSFLLFLPALYARSWYFFYFLIHTFFSPLLRPVFLPAIKRDLFFFFLLVIHSSPVELVPVFFLTTSSIPLYERLFVPRPPFLYPCLCFFYLWILFFPFF